MSDERCDCCDLPVSSCGKAVEASQRAAERAETARLLRLPGATKAAYPGVCGDCGERFEAGSPIQARTAYGRHRAPIERGSGDSPWRSLLCCGGGS